MNAFAGGHDQARPHRLPSLFLFFVVAKAASARTTLRTAVRAA
jgi:hypothetical protein